MYLLSIKLIIHKSIPYKYTLKYTSSSTTSDFNFSIWGAVLSFYCLLEALFFSSFFLSPNNQFQTIIIDKRYIFFWIIILLEYIFIFLIN